MPAPPRSRPGVQALEHVHEADGVHVEDGRGLGIGPQLRRIAGDRQDVAQAQARGAQQVALHAQQVPVPAGVVEDGLEPHLLLDDERRGQGGHAGHGPGAVGHVDGVHAQGPALAGLGHELVVLHALGRHQLHGVDELVLGELEAEAAAVGEGHLGLGLLMGLQLEAAAGLDEGPLLAEGPPHGADVGGRGAAAAAHGAGARGQGAGREAAQVLGAGPVDEAAIHLVGQAGVGLEDDGLGGDGLQALQQAQLGRGAVAADEAHQVGAPGVELLDEPLGLRAEQGLAVIVGGHQGRDGQAPGLLRGEDGLMDLVEVLEGLQHDQVRARPR